MKNGNFYLKRLLFLSILICCVLPLKLIAQNFTIKGDFKGSNTEKLVFYYSDQNNNPVIDTIEIENSKFETSGYIDGFQQVFIKGNIDSRYMEDPNFGFFFLEPGVIEIILEEDHFNQIVVEGSPVQKEYKRIDEKQALLRKRIDEKVSLLRSLSFSNQKASTKKETLEKEINEYQNQYTKRAIDYAYNNPDSYMSAYYGNFYKASISKDSLKLLYDNFSPKVKNTMYANEISKFLAPKKEVDPNKIYDFEAMDLNGKEISLKDFHGNYVLLDFWAGWCKPCLEKHPQLKEIYKKYNSKGFNILGVSMDHSKEEWLESIKKENLGLWQHVFVGFDNFRNEGSINRMFEVQPIPAYILLDKNGRVLERYLAADNFQKGLTDLRARLEEVMR